jgi:hypothetical protein
MRTISITVTEAEAAEALPLLMRHAEQLNEMRSQEILHCEPGDDAWERTGRRLASTNKMIMQLSQLTVS